MGTRPPRATSLNKIFMPSIGYVCMCIVNATVKKYMACFSSPLLILFPFGLCVRACVVKYGGMDILEYFSDHTYLWILYLFLPRTSWFIMKMYFSTMFDLISFFIFSVFQLRGLCSSMILSLYLYSLHQFVL